MAPFNLKTARMSLLGALTVFLLAIPAYGQVANLQDATHSLTATLSAAPATTQPTYAVLWTGEGGPADSIGSTTGVTAKAILSGANLPRSIQTVQVYNGDTAATTVTIAKVVASTSYNLVSATIPVGGSFTWTKEQGVKILDTQGVVASPTIGTVPSGIAATTTAAESGNGVYRKTTITCTLTPLTAANTTGASFGSLKLYDFPEGRIFIQGVTCNFTVIKWTGESIAADGSGDYSLGTTATADATLSTTDVDLLPQTAMLDPFVLGVGRSNVGSALAAAVQFDGTATAKDLYLNAIVDDADVSDADTDTILFTGTIVVTWVFLGDLP